MYRWQSLRNSSINDSKNKKSMLGKAMVVKYLFDTEYVANYTDFATYATSATTTTTTLGIINLHGGK